MQRNVYKIKIEENIDRIVSMVNSEDISSTFGCADRLFWSWKFIDFAGSRFQEIAYCLASLPEVLSSDLSESQKNQFFHLASASIDYWQSLQHSDGSFDEAYPFERSFGAVAFTGFYIGQAVKTIIEKKEDLNANTWLINLGRAADWLCENEESHGFLSNHVAAAAAACYTIYELTGVEKYKERACYFVDKILENQSSEGFYLEYTGFDVGYETHTVFYLSYVWSKNKDVNLFHSLDKSVRFIKFFMHPDGSFGGKYSSRNTEFIMPAGFEILASQSEAARTISFFVKKSITERLVVSLDQMDPQNILPFINNFIFALKHANDAQYPTAKLPFTEDFSKNFLDAGCIIVSKPKFYAIVSWKKGGSLSAFSKFPPYLSYYDSGIFIESTNKRHYSNQLWRDANKTSHYQGQLVVESDLLKIKLLSMSPIKFAALRLTAFISWISPKSARMFKNILVRMLVLQKSDKYGQVIKAFKFNDDNIEISYDLKNLRFIPNKVLFGGRHSVIHMGSSRYSTIGGVSASSRCKEISGSTLFKNKNKLFMNIRFK
jgi:hypothetical protein